MQSLRSTFVPRIIDYEYVLSRATELGLRCVYYNSGAFAHGRDVDVKIVGWLGPDDPTIRADLPATLVRFPEPYAESLTDRLIETWRAHLPGPVWVMPKAHWSYELDHGNRWLADTLRGLGLDPAPLACVANAAAIEFEQAETSALGGFVRELLNRLAGSDFAILFPQHSHLVTVHHHKQLWWQTPDAAIIRHIQESTRIPAESDPTPQASA